MQHYKILWADDEIDHLKPHILFLEKKGYAVTPVRSGSEALEKAEDASFDVIFLDENMPGLTGLETLDTLAERYPATPVVMITKSEEENLMEEAIGSRIADYLIKPVNPKQILLSIKKILDSKRIVSEKTNQGYQQEFQEIAMAFSDHMDHQDWIEIYKKLVQWELKIEQTENKSMKEVLQMQKDEANVNFARFVDDHYKEWLREAEPNNRPLLSHDIVYEKVLPHLEDPDAPPLYFLLIDCLRYDQWKIIENELLNYFKVVEETPYFSILPTTTSYCRNSIFSGQMPLTMSRKHKDIWVNETEEGKKNDHEDEFLRRQLERYGMDDVRFSYHKIIKNHQAEQVLNNFNNLKNNDLNVLVFNFIDMLSHARTDTAFVRELAPDEAAYRAITLSWFKHAPMLELCKRIAESGGRMVITTDHGTIRTKRPYKIVGDRETNTNLRYKQGKNLNFSAKNVIVAERPEDFMLPRVNVSTRFVFGTEDYFFAYPNNYNHYVRYYKDTFQHGGVSLEEMIVPLVYLEAK